MAKKKILVVDDDRNTACLVKYKLEKSGYVATVALDGEEGLERVAKQKPDLIILDIMMPGLDGIATALKLKGKQETSSIPLLMLTAIKEADEMILAGHVGALGYLTKPFEPAALVKRVNELIRGE